MNAEWMNAYKVRKNAVNFSFPSTELPAVITVVLYFFLSDK